MKKAVLSLSGGLDSTCLLVYLLSEGYRVKAYSFDYRQKHSIELEKVKRNIIFLEGQEFKVEHQILDVRDIFSDSNSSLSKTSGVEVPEGHYNDTSMKSTVVENRNIIFASIIYGKALAWANRSGLPVDIFLGTHSGDHEIYPDCRPESRLAAEYCFKVSNYNSESVSYRAPFENIDKGEVLRVGITSMQKLYFSEETINFILNNTHTCYNPTLDGKSCGRCGSCTERLEAFQKNDRIDPIQYVK